MVPVQWLMLVAVAAVMLLGVVNLFGIEAVAATAAQRLSAKPAWPAGVARHVLQTVDSTNAYALRMAPDTPGPAWFLGLEQTAGRGRRARPWAIPRGNFYATLLLHPTEPPEQYCPAQLCRQPCLARCLCQPDRTARRFRVEMAE